MDTSDYTKVSEGKATVLYPKGAKVFYNPIQRFNRDISILAIRAWTELYATKSLKRKRNSDDPDNKPFLIILEALAASGLRSIRYAREIPLVKTIIANDLSTNAVQSITRNTEYNIVESIVQATHDDANVTMHQNKTRPVHIVDLDPYGSAVPFLDAAFQCIDDGGLMLVTCTDLGVLAGNGYPEKCFSHYGGTTVRNDATHESALRLLLNQVANTGARYGKAIEPLLSLSIDYYIRCFIRVRHSPQTVKENIGKSSVVYNCTGCQTTHIQPLGRVIEYESGQKRRSNKNKGTKYPGPKNPKSEELKEKPKRTLLKFGYAKGPIVSPFCEFCDNPHHISGPLWTGRLHSKPFINKMLDMLPEMDAETYQTKERIKGMLILAQQELADVPFYVNPANMASKVRCPVPPLNTFVSALLNSGYEASLTHAQPGCVKTTAPPDFLWDVLRAWAAEHKEGSKPLKDSPGSHIILKPQTHQVSFEPHVGANSIEKLRKSRIVRFQQNPEAEWGPMAKPQ